IIILIIIFSTSYFNYLLFHSLAEIFSVIIAGGIFIVGWNSRKYVDESYFLILGISALFVAVFDTLHLLAYEGLNIFPEHGSNLTTQLWISGRYIQVSSFLFATLFRNRSISRNFIIISCTLVSIILLFLVFYGLFPVCFIDGVGLTPFKIVSEYVIIILYAIVLTITIVFKYDFAKQVYPYLLLILFFFMCSEFVFTLYHTVYGPINEIGHILKIIAFYLLYKVLVKVGFSNPVDILFKELKSSKDKMRELADRYFSLFENSPISVWIYDFTEVKKYIDYLKAKGINNFLEYFTENEKDLHKCISLIKILDFNKETFNMYRAYKREDLIYGFESTFTENALNAFKNELYAFSMGKNLFEYEANLKTLDKEEIHVLKRVSIVPGYEESWSKVIVNVLDITLRVQAEKKLEEFTSSVSHELRTPITVLKQSLTNLSKYNENLDKALKSDLFKVVVRNTDLISELIEDILIISRIDERGLILEKEEISIHKMFLDLISQMEPKINAKSIYVKLNIDKNLQLVVDPKRFSQIFRIFIDNAIKYSKSKSTIEIYALNHYSGKYNPKESEGTLFQIVDQGIGIKQKDIPRVFERFFRSSEVSDIPGTGLGLSIAKELINFHGGSVFIDSQHGEGTTVSVFFPYQIEGV
ncbi:MAG: MASE3 domain-containing protein, partial [Candidatus Hermodarchaeota archaeon]